MLFRAPTSGKLRPRCSRTSKSTSPRTFRVSRNHPFPLPESWLTEVCFPYPLLFTYHPQHFHPCSGLHPSGQLDVEHPRVPRRRARLAGLLPLRRVHPHEQHVEGPVRSLAPGRVERPLLDGRQRGRFRWRQLPRHVGPDQEIQHGRRFDRHRS